MEIRIHLVSGEDLSNNAHTIELNNSTSRPHVTRL